MLSEMTKGWKEEGAGGNRKKEGTALTEDMREEQP